MAAHRRMGGVISRLAGALIVLFAAFCLAVPAWGQDDEEKRAKAVDKVLRDYRDDGKIDACDHTRRALRDTLKQLPAEADIETPDLRPALEAGIEQVKADECEPEPTPTPSPTPAPTFTPAPTATPAPTLTPDDSDDSLGSVAPLPNNDGGGGNGGSGTPGSDDVTPLEPEVTPVPPAASPAPVAPPAEPSGTPPPPTYANADDGVPVALLVLAGVLALVALLALLYAALSRLGWGERRLAGVRRSWDEALFRAGGTWGDFADWLRVGR
jgi:hypothetical protein